MLRMAILLSPPSLHRVGVVGRGSARPTGIPRGRRGEWIGAFETRGIPPTCAIDRRAPSDSRCVDLSTPGEEGAWRRWVGSAPRFFRKLTRVAITDVRYPPSHLPWRHIGNATDTHYEIAPPNTSCGANCGEAKFRGSMRRDFPYRVIKQGGGPFFCANRRNRQRGAVGMERLGNMSMNKGRNVWLPVVGGGV